MNISLRKKNGQIAVELLFLAAVVVTLVGGFVSLAASFLQISVREQNKLQAFTIAEAGIEYYRWHLAHASADYQDGTGHAGPYIHPYYDKDGDQIGQFNLTITPPPPGSTIVTIQSAGTVIGDPSVKKVIAVRMGIPSFAKYAWVLNDSVNFGTAAEVFGIIDSNSGIHFDGFAHNLVESALTTYTDPDTGLTEWAVWTANAPTDPRPPTALPTRADVFAAGRTLAVPAVDFAGITQDLSGIKATASSSGYYASSSGVFGYDLALATTSFTLYKVTALVATPTGCSNSLTQTGWGTWSIQSETQIATGTIPQNGDMFFEDNLWVRGQVNNARVTIASGKFPDNPSTRTNIIVNNSIKYTNFNASDTIALIAQNNILIGLRSDDVLTIDAAMIAQNGFIGRFSYASANCGTSQKRTSLTTLGIIGTNLRSALFYSGTNGYQSRSYNYDTNLLFSPPPSFPLTTDQYSLISWQEVQ